MCRSKVLQICDIGMQYKLKIGINALIWATFNSWFIKLYNIPKNKYIYHDTVSYIGDTIRIILTCLIKQYIDRISGKKDLVWN